jgi:hypothetical protein
MYSGFGARKRSFALLSWPRTCRHRLGDSR